MIRLVLAMLVIAMVIGYSIAKHNQAESNLISQSADLKSWVWKQEPSVSGGVSIDQGAIRCDSMVTDETIWHLSLYHKGIRVESGRWYRVAFSAKADRPRTIELAASQGEAGNYASIGLSAPQYIGRTWEKHEAAFTPTGKVGHTVWLPIFNVGDAKGSVWIKDVVAEQIK